MGDCQLLNVDLGCGATKRAGYVGIDRFPLPGVDIVCDVNQGIPLETSSVDYLIASHSLEHFDSIPQIINEIWRVCKDRALVTIISPYYNTGLNIANPYHIQKFNEHSARFFTNNHDVFVDSDEYKFPTADFWGLGHSDNSSWNADFRPLHVEFLYMPPYRHLDKRLKQLLRKSVSDVCDVFSLQLLVVKSDISRQEIESLADRDTWPTNPDYETRRAQEIEFGQGNAFTRLFELPGQLADLQRQADDARARVEEGFAAFRQVNDYARARERALDEATQVSQSAISDLSIRVSGAHQSFHRRLDGVQVAVQEAIAYTQGEFSHLSDRVALTNSAIKGHVAAFDTRIGQISDEQSRVRLDLGSIVANISEFSDVINSSSQRLDRVERQLVDVSSISNALIDRLQCELLDYRELFEKFQHYTNVALDELELRLAEQQRLIADINAEIAEKITAATIAAVSAAEFSSVPRIDDLNDRITTVTTAFTRRIVGLENRVAGAPAASARTIDDLQSKIGLLECQNHTLVGRVDALMHASAKSAAHFDAALTRIVSARIAGERNLPRLLQVARQYIRRSRDDRGLIAVSPFCDWPQPGREGAERKRRVQLGEYWREGDLADYAIGSVEPGLIGLDLAAWVFLPPEAPATVFAFDLMNLEGSIIVSGDCYLQSGPDPHQVLPIRFPAIYTAGHPLRLRLIGKSVLAKTGVRLYEIRRIQPLSHRLMSVRPLSRVIYE